MNNLFVKIIILISIFSTFNLVSQSLTGPELINQERWWAAEKLYANSTDEQEIFYKGFSQMKTEDYDKAKASFNTISTKPFGKIGLGMLELNSGNKDGANKLFESAASETKNKNPDIFIAISRAIAYSNALDKSAGIEWAKKAVDMNKMNANYRMVWGDAYLYTQDGGSAITQYEYASQYDAKLGTPFAKIGQTYYRSRTYSLALENLKKAIAKDPNNLLALSYLVDIYSKYKSYDSAKIFQNILLEKGDKNPVDMAMLANINFSQKDYDGAINIITEIIKGDNKFNYLNRLIGYSFYETKKPKEAVDYLEKFLATQPTDKIIASDYEYLGKAYIEGYGDTAKAIETIRKSVAFNPNDKEILKGTAETFKNMKRYDEAIEFYKRVTELPDASADDYFQLANAYKANKDYINAEAGFTKVLELLPSSAGTYFQRAYVKMLIDPEQATSSAKEDFKKFIELTVGMEDKYLKQIVFGKIYMAKDALKNLNDKALGKQYLDEVLTADPSNAEALELMKYTE